MMCEIKPVLRQMIDNNKPHWRPETIRGAYKMLDEYEAKAKAFDRIVEERNRIGKLMHNKEYPQVFTDEAFWNIDDIIIDAESGEYDA